MNGLHSKPVDTSGTETDLLKWTESGEDLQNYIRDLLNLQSVAKFTSDIRAILIENSSMKVLQNLRISTSNARIMFTLNGKEYSISVVNGFKYNFNGKEMNSGELLREVNTLIFSRYVEILKNDFDIVFERESREGSSYGIPSMQGMKAGDNFLAIFGLKHGRIHEKIARFDSLFGLSFWNMSGSTVFEPRETFRILADYIRKIEK